MVMYFYELYVNTNHETDCPHSADAKVLTGSKRKSSQSTGASSSKRRNPSTTSPRLRRLTTVVKAGKMQAKENKSNSSPRIVQTASYASEMLSVKGQTRDHALGMLTLGWCSFAAVQFGMTKYIQTIGHGYGTLTPRGRSKHRASIYSHTLQTSRSS